jgi:CubicO group peptidase (beta-lactamase class C family)
MARIRTIEVECCPRAVLLALACLGCYPPAAPTELAEGIWSGSDGAEQLLFEFVVSHVGTRTTVHVLHDGRKITEMPARITSVDAPWLDVRGDDFGHYRGRIDLENERIDGELVDLRGNRRHLVLERVAIGDVAGLRARPAPGVGDPAYSLVRPPDLGDGWPTATPDAVNVDPARIEDLVGAIVTGEAGIIHSVLVVRDGKLVVEEYFHGYDRDDLHTITSCTKGVASLLIGIAIDQGRIAGVTDPILEFFPEQRAGAAYGWDQVTLEHVLTMTVGRSDEEWLYTGPIEIMEPPYHYILTTDVSGTHGAQRRHGGRDVNLLAGVIRHATGLHADAFAEKSLFEPLGIRVYDWSEYKKDSFPMMHGTLQLRPRDLAKIGALVLEDGRWQGKQVVSAEWIRASTSARAPITAPEQYGYLWSLKRLPDHRGGSDPVIFASGWGSQLVYVVPSLNAIIVITGGNQFNGKTSAHERVLVERLLPAFDG